MLLGVDDSLGRIVAALARKGILDDTIVVFTATMATSTASTASTRSGGWPMKRRSAFRSSSAIRGWLRQARRPQKWGTTALVTRGLSDASVQLDLSAFARASRC
jgi:arylsulfatase A-like enzyme